jgi:hypothetical protein
MLKEVVVACLETYALMSEGETKILFIVDRNSNRRPSELGFPAYIYEGESNKNPDSAKKIENLQ